MSIRSLFAAFALAAAVLSTAVVSTPTTSAGAAALVTRQMVVTKALEYRYYPYALTGSHPTTGFSCIGFVWYVFQSLGVDMPGNLNSAMAAYPRIPERDLLPGDIVFFQKTMRGWQGPTHVGIYIGNGEMISAENFDTGVHISSLRDGKVYGNYWQKHYLVSERPLIGAGGSQSSIPSTSRPQGVVTSLILNLRSDPSLSAIVVKVLSKGTSMRVLGQWDGWLHVTVDGLNGWVMRAGVELNSPILGGKGGSHGVGKSGKRYAVSAGVNIHSEPALTASVISVTTPGMYLPILKSKNGFYKIRTRSGITGWILARFFSLPNGVSPIIHHGWRVQPRGRLVGMTAIRVHLRTGPSLNARIIKWVKPQTRVTILGHVPLWDHVRLSHKLSGFIYSQFVKS